MSKAAFDHTARKAVAIVGVGAIMPDASSADAFWQNIRDGRYSIRDVPAGYWDPALYYDADPKAPDKAYSKIGGFATDWHWDPIAWKLPIPPKVGAQMDRGQKWAIMAARQALMDFGYPDRPLDRDRTAVILGNAMAGDMHYMTATRILTPEIVRELLAAPTFAALPADVRTKITEETYEGVRAHMPPVNEDTMPGELSNIIAGRVAAMFDLHGPNYVTDAACASAMAAFSAAIEGLVEGRYDSVLTGGVDANMNPSSFIKFCKIGALSATGSRPFDAEADGFVMGEGAALFLVKRLADAERDGDKIYAVVRGIGGSSDGKGKGITAPNPAGQVYAVRRGWENAGLAPNQGTMIEGHGTSTRVGDLAETNSLIAAMKDFQLPAGAMPLGSVKSNIGHLKAGAGAAGMFKATLALHHKLLPPSLGFQTPNPKINFAEAPFYVNSELRQWELRGGAETRTAGVSAFGFGGTNFHAVLEEHVPGRLVAREPLVSVPASYVGSGGAPVAQAKAPLRGALVLGAADKAALISAAKAWLEDVKVGKEPARGAPAATALRAAERLVIDWGNAAELEKKLVAALRALGGDNAAMWRALKAQGIFYRTGAPAKVAFLYTGQGSQYVNMMQGLREREPIVREVFEEADRVMTPLLGKPLSAYIYVDPTDEAAVRQATQDLMQTAITQPAVLATDQSLTKLMAAYGVRPDMVMGHSLGEYGALVAAGALPFADALEAVSARGREMTKVSVEDCGLMAAVFAPIEEIEQILTGISGYVVIANLNSSKQAVIGGSTEGVKEAAKVLEERGYQARMLPVSHAFHTRIVAPASGPLQDVLRRLDVRPPEVPLVANTTGTFYPMHPGVAPEIVDILGEQIASPVQFVKGLKTLYEAGCRVFVEMGPKKALAGFVEDVLGDHEDVLALFSNHPKLGDETSFNQALCGLYAAGVGLGEEPKTIAVERPAAVPLPAPLPAMSAPRPVVASPAPAAVGGGRPLSATQYGELGRVFADFLDRGMQIYSGGHAASATATRELPSIVISGAALGLPGTEHIFDERNVERLLRGQQCIGTIPLHLRRTMIDKKIVRLVKDPVTGSGSFVTLDSVDETIKLAGLPGALDLPEEFGYPKDRMAALDIATELAIGAGIQAMRDAGIPLLRTYKTTTKGTKLPDRWMLPECMRDDTGVIFGAAFPGYESFSDDMRRFHEDKARRESLEALRSLRAGFSTDAALTQELDRRIGELERAIEAAPYNFDRRFVFKILGMGHSQFAEYIGARGPNTLINAACASGTQAIGLAQDWIQAGRCRRVIVLSADSVTSPNLMEWIGTGFLATGAAATDAVVEEAALPFDRRRHGLLLGMGAAAVVVESADSVAERGVRPLTEVMETQIGNSAFHGSRLDVNHITQVVEQLVSRAERRWGISREQMAEQLMFVSHETFTPARGGSAQAEVNALRQVFGPAMDKVVVANTKGLTGHAMGTGIEDVLAVKALETGVVPPVPNFREIDPDLGNLNLSRGGSYPIVYALRLAAGFGSQMALSLQRWVPTPDGTRPRPDQLGFAYRTDHAVWTRWLADATGYDAPELEVFKNTLRVKEQGPPLRAPRPFAPLEEAAAVQQPASAPPARTPAPALARPVQAPLPAVAKAAAPPAPPAPPLAAAPVKDPVVERVMQIIAAQTGYPTDMLDPELDLEADLGVDTVKQAETFAAVREAYDIARDDSVQLRDFPTIKHVVEFVRSRRPDLVAPTPAPTVAPASAAAPASSAPTVDPIVSAVMQIIADQTGYPVDMLDPDLDLEADLGVDTVKQAETFAAVREAYNIERDDSVQLRNFPTINHVVEFVRSRRPDLAAAPAAAPPTPAAAAPTARSSAATNEVVQRVIAIVAEQTGYPPDMLDLDLDLEADLGIDTVKQAETFAAVREAFDIPRADTLQLRDFPTMKHVIGFVYQHRPDLEAAAASAPAPVKVVSAAPAAAAAPAPAVGLDPVAQKVIEIVAAQTGYPPDMLDLDLDLEADLGVDTVKQAETFAAVRDAFGIARVESLQLRDFPTMKHVIGFVYDHKPELRPSAPTAVAPSAAPAAPSSSVAEAKPSMATEAEPATDAVTQKVIEIIAAQTGYPPDMLDLDLDLEADLGIDTVKQAETFAAVREAFGIDRVESLQLRDFPTMKHVIGFVFDHKPELRGAAAVTADASTVATGSSAAAGLLRGDMAAAATIPRRLPVPMLRPPSALCKPTGVALAAGRRVVVMHDRDGGVGDALVTLLQERGVSVLSIVDTPPADELTARLEAFAAGGGVQGIYWLPGLDPHAAFETLTPEAFGEALRVRVKLLYHAMRALYQEVQASGTFLLSAVRLGGRHGYDDAGAAMPLGGAITGFTKSFKRERPEALVKAVDFSTTATAETIAAALIEETLSDAGAVEVGHCFGDRWTVGLHERPLDEPVDGELAGLELGADSVFVITGAAGSIVSAIVADLAAATAGTFYLLDLTAEPDPDSDDLRRFATDKEGLKRDIFERIKARGERATPKLVDRELANLERQQSALAAIQAVQAAGGAAYYKSGNLLDAAYVTAVIEEIRERHGRVDVLLHAAGLEISRFLPDKVPAEFDLVFDVKVQGWHNLLHAIGEMPLAATVSFSSIAGRFGNGGQTDYSAANDLLCKTSSSFRSLRPDTRGVALDWTAWGGIGMAVRGSIPKMMELARIDMLPPEAGIAMVRRELTLAPRGAEVVVAQGLGIMLDEFDETGGLDAEAINAQQSRPMAAHVVGMGLYTGLTVETELDPEEQPFLFDHQIDGTPVLPGVMGIEAFGELAKVLFPDWHVAAVQDVAFLAPFKFYRHQRRKLELRATFSRVDDDELWAECQLVGKRKLPNMDEPQTTVHFTAGVRLTRKPLPEETVTAPGPAHGVEVGSADIYQVYFHGPAYQVLEKAWRHNGSVVGLLPADLPADQQPATTTQQMLPRLIELCFQTAGIWQIGTAGQMALPWQVDRVSVLRDLQTAEGRLYALVTPSEASSYDAVVADEAGHVFVRVHGYRTVELPGGVDDDRRRPLQSAMLDGEPS